MVLNLQEFFCKIMKVFSHYLVNFLTWYKSTKITFYVNLSIGLVVWIVICLKANNACLVNKNSQFTTLQVSNLTPLMRFIIGLIFYIFWSKLKKRFVLPRLHIWMISYIHRTLHCDQNTRICELLLFNSLLIAKQRVYISGKCLFHHWSYFSI